MSRNKFEELAKRLAARTAELEEQRTGRPSLTIVREARAHGMDALTRESHCKMIRHIRRRWGHHMQQLIDQATFGLAGIEQLADDDLIKLHMDMERAQECIRDGVTFEDAGLLRSRYG